MDHAAGGDPQGCGDAGGASARQTTAEDEERVLTRRHDEEDGRRDEQPVVVDAQHGDQHSPRGRATFPSLFPRLRYCETAASAKPRTRRPGPDDPAPTTRT